MMHTLDNFVHKEFITKDAKPDGSDVCWAFCRYASGLLGSALPMEPTQLLKRVGDPLVSDLVMFTIGSMWHCGLLWPDGLHFLHVYPEGHAGQILYMVHKDRLTLWPWSHMLEGFYYAG